MRKISRKAVVLLMAVVMIIAMAAPTFAANGAGGEVVGNPTVYTTPINVKVVVSSCQYSYSPLDSTNINSIYNVKLVPEGTAGESFSVGDVLTNLNTQQSEITAQTSDEQYEFTNATLYNIVKHTGSGDYTFGPHIWGAHGYSKRIRLDGWMFRVNGKLPLTSWTGDANGGPYGADADHTYVKDGDVVYFYMDHPWKESGTDMSTQFISADASYTPGASSTANGTLTVQMKKTNDYFNNWNGSTFPWTINTYSNFAPGQQYSAFIKEVTKAADGTVTESSKGSVVLNTSGYGTKSIKLDSSKRYYIHIAASRDWHLVSGYASQTGTSTVTIKHLLRTIAYDRINF